MYKKVKILYDKISESHPTLDDADKLIYNDLLYFKKCIDDDILVMQLNWGIHPTKAYVIPFLGKDKPSINSTFSSIILTFFLTIDYYYRTNLDITPLMVNFIIQTKIYKRFRGYNYLNISVEQVKDIYTEYKDKIIEYIISTIVIKTQP